jgi:hypothetical protein
MSNKLKALWTFAFLLCLLVAGVRVYPQAEKGSVKAYIEFSGQGMMKRDTVASDNYANFIINVVGGFVEFYPTNVYVQNRDKLRAHLYRNEGNGLIESGKESPFKDSIKAKLYLKVNQEYTLDIIDQSKTVIVQRFIIRRVKLLPKLMMFQLFGGMGHLTAIPQQLNARIEAVGNVRVSIEAQAPLAVSESEVEYTLINLKTGDQKKLVATGVVELPALNAGSEYELRYNYAIQPESVAKVTLEISEVEKKFSSVLIYGTAGMLAIILILGLIAFINWRKNRVSKNQRQKLEDAAISLQTSLNPHFTFNALSTIQGLINTGRIDDANEYLQEFGALLRKTLTKSQQVYNTLDQELEMMRLYLRLESLRFNFKWEIEVDPALNPSTIEIPTLLLQPLIENCIKHAMPGKGEAGFIKVICQPTHKTGSFTIVVRDNGIWKGDRTAEGFGLALTQKRVATINKIRTHGNIYIQIQNDEGTVVRITFENWNQA